MIQDLLEVFFGSFLLGLGTLWFVFRLWDKWKVKPKQEKEITPFEAINQDYDEFIKRINNKNDPHI